MLDLAALNYLGRGGNLPPNVNKAQLMERRYIKEGYIKERCDVDTKDTGAMIILYIIIWIFAIYKALQCTNNMKVVHLFFATTNPLLYLIFSFTVKDFC